MKSVLKRLHSTLFLVVLTVLGGLYLFWNERGPATAPGAVVLLRAPQNEAKRVVLKPSGVILEKATPQATFGLRDSKTGVRAVPDEAASQRFWAQVELLQSLLPVANPERLENYGLQNPRASIEIDGQLLQLGGPASFDKRLIYARGNGRIALVNVDLLAITRQTLTDWRDKSVLRSVAGAGSFSLRRSGAKLLFDQSTEGVWQLREARQGAVTVKADSEKVEAALDALDGAKIQRWIDEHGRNPARFGFGKPLIAFRSGGKQLDIGAKTSSGYAARHFESVAGGDEGAIFEVPASLVAILNRPLKEWRDKRVAVFEINEISRLEVTSQGKTRILKRDGDNWHLENAPNDPEIRAAALDLLDFAVTLRARQFIDNANFAAPKLGLKSPVLQVSGFNDSGSLAFELRIGRAKNKLFASNRSNSALTTSFELDEGALAQTEPARSKIFKPS